MLAVHLGDILWSLLVVYVMVMYFVIVITVIFDIFRSDDLSGVAKALWSLGLIVFPIITLVVYLVTRGDGIGKRNLAKAEQSRAATESYIRDVAAGGGGVATELEKAKSLHDAGALSADEYERLKSKLLA